MDGRPSFRFCVAVAVAEIALTMIAAFFFMLAWGIAPVPAIKLLRFVAFPALGLPACTVAILYGIYWLNRRDDPRHAKRPPDDP